MNTEVQNLVEQIRQSTANQINKKVLREKIMTDLHMVYRNGMFLIGPTVLSFVATWPDETLYLEDVYENPIEVNKEEFLYNARLHYQTVMNTWHQQHEELKQIRKI